MRWKLLPQTGTRPVERSSHSITVIGDSILLFGGEHDPRVPVGNDLYEYGLADSSWRVLEVQGERPSPRVAHAAAAVGTALYVFGGRSGLEMGEGASDDLFAFNTATRTWTRLHPGGTPPPKRSYHAMAALGPKLYVFGGCGEAGRLNDLHEYDTRTNMWTALAAPQEDVVPGRGGCCLVAVPPPLAAAAGAEAGAAAAESGPARAGLLHVIAGFCGHELDDMHVYSIADNSWCGSCCPTCGTSTTTAATASTTVAAAPGCRISARSVFGAVQHLCDSSGCAHRDSILAYGGEVDPSDKGHAGAGDFCASLMVYGSAGSGGWRAAEAGEESPGPRGWFASTVGPEGQLIVHGGLDANNERLGDMFALDLHSSE